MDKLERKNILEITYSPLFLSGSDGVINRVDDKKVYKEFHPSMSLVNKNRKIRKLEYLISCKNLNEYYANIYYIVMDILNKNPRGYVMQNLTCLKKFNSNNFETEEKINILKKLKEIVFLKFYSEYGISFLDLRSPNILINAINNPILLDLDGIKTTEEALDTTPTDLKYYYIKGGNNDINALIYMFNKLTKEFLALEDYEMDKEGEIFKIYPDFCIPDSIFDNELMFEHIKQFNKRKSNN